MPGTKHYWYVVATSQAEAEDLAAKGLGKESYTDAIDIRNQIRHDHSIDWKTAQNYRVFSIERLDKLDGR